jgi:hypothetical protein
MNNFMPYAVGIAGLLIGLAIVSVIVSKQANTPDVVRSIGGTFAGIIGAAVQPVTGSSSWSQAFGGTSTAGAVGGAVQ